MRWEVEQVQERQPRSSLNQRLPAGWGRTPRGSHAPEEKPLILPPCLPHTFLVSSAQKNRRASWGAFPLLPDLTVQGNTLHGDDDDDRNSIYTLCTKPQPSRTSSHNMEPVRLHQQGRLGTTVPIFQMR